MPYDILPTKPETNQSTKVSGTAPALQHDQRHPGDTCQAHIFQLMKQSKYLKPQKVGWKWHQQSLDKLHQRHTTYEIEDVSGHVAWSMLIFWAIKLSHTEPTLGRAHHCSPKMTPDIHVCQTYLDTSNACAKPLARATNTCGPDKNSSKQSSARWMKDLVKFNCWCCQRYVLPLPAFLTSTDSSLSKQHQSRTRWGQPCQEHCFVPQVCWDCCAAQPQRW